MQAMYTKDPIALGTHKQNKTKKKEKKERKKKKEKRPWW